MATLPQNVTGIIPVPTMSTQGLIHDSSNKFDAIMAHVFAADYNQTYLYPGHVCSLAHLIERGGSKKADIEESLRQGFFDYLNRYYQGVSVEVEVTNLDSSSSKLDFKLNIVITEQAQQSQYGMLIVTASKKLQEIIKLNNYGG